MWKTILKLKKHEQKKEKKNTWSLKIFKIKYAHN